MQLYDLASDTAEEKNVQSENPEIVKRLTALMEKYIVNGRSTPGAPEKNDVEVGLMKKANQ